MTDATLASRSPLYVSILANLAGAFAASVWALLREWHRRSRSRWELSTYSYHERAEIGRAHV